MTHVFDDIEYTLEVGQIVTAYHKGYWEVMAFTEEGVDLKKVFNDNLTKAHTKLEFSQHPFYCKVLSVTALTAKMDKMVNDYNTLILAVGSANGL